MKTIKVFLASSEELGQERLQFDSLFNHLNRIFRPRGLYLELSKWEYLDSSMGAKHKQEEYNEELKTCDVCLVLYWTKFGEYTKEELETAYNELKAGRNPQRLYVFFKEPADVTPELQAFKDSFAEEFGHFYCKFENIDSMRLHFLLQLETFQNTLMQEAVKVEDSKVKVDGNEIANLDNIPFAANNKEYCKLKKQIEDLEEEVKNLEDKFQISSDSDIEELLGIKRSELYNAKEELSKYENILFATTCTITQQQRGKVSERMAKSIEAFEAGNASNASNLLSGVLEDSAVLKNVIAQTTYTEEQREKAVVIISELILSASTTLADSSKKIDKRIATASKCYYEAYILAKQFDYDKEALLYLLEKYHDFLSKYNKTKELNTIVQELLALGISIYGEESPKVAEYYNNAAWCLLEQNNYEQALECCNKSLQLSEKLLDANNPHLASNYRALAAIYEGLNKLDKSLECTNKALNILRTRYGENHLEVAKCYTNLVSFHCGQENYKEAQTCLDKAMSIAESISDEKDGILANLYHLSAILYYKQNNFIEYDTETLNDKDYKKAIGYCHEAEKFYLHIYGSYHSDLARLYILMGDIEVAHYDGADARSYYLLAQRIFEKVYGKNSIEVANIYIKMSNLPESSSGSEASVYLEKALETMIAATGADSLETASCYMYLGDENKKYIENREDVVEYYKRALNIWILHKGENSPEALELYNRLYNVYIYIETDREKLGELLDKMYTISSALYGESDSETLEYNRLLGHLYYNDGPEGKTIEIWDKKLKTEISHYGEKSETVAETYTAYGYFYNDHKEYQKACEYLTKAHDIYIEILGKKDLKSQMIERAIKYIREEKMHKKSFWSRIFG